LVDPVETLTPHPRQAQIPGVDASREGKDKVNMGDLFEALAGQLEKEESVGKRVGMREIWRFC